MASSTSSVMTVAGSGDVAEPELQGAAQAVDEAHDARGLGEHGHALQLQEAQDLHAVERARRVGRRDLLDDDRVQAVQLQILVNQAAFGQVETHPLHVDQAAETRALSHRRGQTFRGPAPGYAYDSDAFHD